MRRFLRLMGCLLLLSACSELTARRDADSSRQSAATPTALSDEIINAADAEYLLLSNIYARSSPSVVNIEVVSGAETRRGAGFIYDRQGRVVTNAHLVKAADTITVTLRNALALQAELVGLDSFSDLAVIKVSAADGRLAPLRIGESASVKVGQRAISIGNPYGLKASLTTGIVSGLGRTLPSAELIEAGAAAGFDNPSIIQIDAAVHPGNSGGPLLDSKGLVIGITTAMQSDSGQFQGIGFAVPADTMRRVIPDLIAAGRVEYAWMGISVMPEDGGYGVAGLSEALDLPVERGVLLRGVSEGSPAHLAGLRGGDTLVDIRGKSVCSGGDLIVAVNGYYFDNLDALITYLVQNTRPGDELELVVIRGRQASDVKVRLQSRPSKDRSIIDCDSGR
ncbi:MAG: trypsin-like peptidase domain-containing protein [Chloroflexota bacterium]|nr:trypsin-like peptidase domain-containing protein [Chloroflexota bacterium]MDE2908791.1 trypsin-like peptidase domain-containing protein [Chloroflexota bacterium]